MQITHDLNKLSLKTIHELLGQSFFIPAYQRGYRWTEIQVQELLDDIWEFTKSSDQNQEQGFYCLQPIVVVNSSEGWQVVDGQQRLTTLYLILHYLEQEHLRRSLLEAYKTPLYDIQYETRSDSASFLAHIHESMSLSNIDYFYMDRAYQFIQNWFSTKDYNDNNEFLQVLLAKPTDKGRKVKVIWYDLSNECLENRDYAIEVFSRINIGKIPLTNAELVRALFLQQQAGQSHQVDLKKIQIATEWDSIEKRLQEPTFWYFISNSDQRYPTRIEYIFDLMMGKKESDEAFFTFHQFAAEFRDGASQVDAELLWQQVKGYFLTFEEWFQDKELYHLIGFLVACGEPVKELKALSEQKNTTKTEFKKLLRSRIQAQVGSGGIEELNYRSDAALIRKILLLFSVETLLASTEAEVRFPFDRYKKERWDIEHIRSQAELPSTPKAQAEWLNIIIDYFTQQPSNTEQEQCLLTQLQQQLESGNFEKDFQDLYSKVMHHFNDGSDKIKDGWLDMLGNLTLLDTTTNRSYKNAPFQVKRDRIIRNDRQGAFMPIGTKNVFLKYYSKSATNLLSWTHVDAEDYLKAITEVLKPYFSEEHA